MAGKGFTGMINTFMMGCDPEFVALDAQGKQVNVASYVDTTEVGYDHGGRVGELRPTPTRGTYALVKKLQRLINSTQVNRIPCSKLRAGAKVLNDTLGGHVHFGFSVPSFDRVTGGPDVRIRALDKVTKTLEDLDILPKDESIARRKGGHYGRWSDVRDSGGHMEYRTMASWLYDPRIAYLCLTAAKLAAADPKGTLEAIKNVASFPDLVRWFENYRSKDINACRATERVLDKSLKDIQVYPDVNIKERWQTLGF